MWYCYFVGNSFGIYTHHIDITEHAGIAQSSGAAIFGTFSLYRKVGHAYIDRVVIVVTNIEQGQPVKHRV